MSKTIYRIYYRLRKLGFDPRQFLVAIGAYRKGWFKRDHKEFLVQRGNDNRFAMGQMYPILTDRKDTSGTISGHYFHQDLFVAREIFNRNPSNHLDIGSRVDGFVAHVASFRSIDIIDIRPLPSSVKHINYRQADLMAMPDELVNSYQSVSSLHAIEHFGLGRYGDPIDYNGHLKAIENIHRILVPSGFFYFSVPIGPQRVEFNAMRVFSVKYLIDVLDPLFTISSFSYVDDTGKFHEDVRFSNAEAFRNFNCEYGCGIFVLQKK